MPDRSNSNALSRLIPWLAWLSVLVVGLVVGLRWFPGPGEGTDDPPTASRDDVDPARTSPSTLTGGATPDAAGGARAALDPDPGPAGPTAPGAEPDPRPGEEPDVWALVERLEALAEDPTSFHGAALPVVDRLTERCRALAAEADVSAASPADGAPPEPPADTLWAAVVQDPGRDPLVRGAVWLAISPLLDEQLWLETLDAWFLAPPGDVPLELVRAGALGAARRGEPATCDQVLDLRALMRIPVHGPVDLPHLYPLRLDRVAPAYTCASVRAWLDAPDPRRALFRVSDGPPDPTHDLEAAADYFATAEVLYLVWGHQALRDDEVLASVLDEVRPALDADPGASLVHFRAACFLVHSLALCDATLFDEAVRMAHSEDPLVGATSRSMEGLAGGVLGVGTIARIEELRYSTSARDEADLMLTLRDVGERMADLGPGALAEDDAAAAYLDELVQDVALSESVRASALTAVASSRSFPVLEASASRVFAGGSDPLLCAIAMNELMDQARTRPEHRDAVLSLLIAYRQDGSPGKLSGSLDRYIAELGQ